MRPTDGDDSSSADASVVKGVRVLVVEDDWTLATALKRLLDT